MKYALLSMDVEDWYHADYFFQKGERSTYSMMDGLNEYVDIMRTQGIQSTYFVLGEVARDIKRELNELKEDGSEIASHGWDHTRPMDMKVEEFREDVVRTKGYLEDMVGSDVTGYRAPNFGIDRSRLDVLRAAGYSYDSSSNPFSDHPLYETLDLGDFRKLNDSVGVIDGFVEYQICTRRVLGVNIPISGGAYLRALPWMFMKRYIKDYVQRNDIFVFYIHPFELSSKDGPENVSKLNRWERTRFTVGRSTVKAKLNKMIDLLRRVGCEFTTYSQMNSLLLRKERLDKL